jgi:hypothetical protein
MDYDKYVHLHREHERMHQAYRAAVDLLIEAGFKATDAEYLRLKISAEDARHDLEIARLKLEEAESSEKCGASAGWKTEGRLQQWTAHSVRS